MCGRFAQHASIKTLMKLYNIDETAGEHISSYNVGPMQKATALISVAGKIRSGQLFWGLVPPWAKDKTFAAKMINARSETLETKNSFRVPFQKKRCIIPVNGFFEWSTTPAGKQPWYFHNPEERILSLAGLWETWKGSDPYYHTFTIVTTEANSDVKSVHDRMPVILDKKSVSNWLNPDHQDVDDLKSLIRMNQDFSLEKYRVSPQMNKIGFDGPDCLQSMDS